MAQKEYDLRGKIYIQNPLVLGQIMALLPLIEDVKFGDKTKPFAIAQELGPKLHSALAVILLQKGIDEPEPEKIKGAMKELEGRAEQIAYSIEAEQALEVIEDFFAFNRASSIIEKLVHMMAKVRKQIIKRNSTSR